VPFLCVAGIEVDDILAPARRARRAGADEDRLNGLKQGEGAMTALGRAPGL